MKEFLEIGETSLRPQLGRKGKEGYLRKCSGGYLQNYSSRTGDFIKTWRKRWFVLHDNFVAYYKAPGDVHPLGCIQIDQKFTVAITGRVVTITNRTRKLVMFASSQRVAVEWAEALNAFYETTPRRHIQPFSAHFPPRPSTSISLYVCGREYFAALALALMQAKEEILIASWMVSPTLILTRPPLPPIRLDQILKYKAERGVKIYVLLYKEVELSGTGNDSMKCRTHLESLSPTNICVMRHPNKLIGGSTAILWSHHEKIVIVDRTVGFVGGIDPCFGRYDDERHLLSDEDGVIFPGKDYYQPGRGKLKPVLNIDSMDSYDAEYDPAEDSVSGGVTVIDDMENTVDRFSDESIEHSENSWAMDDSGEPTNDTPRSRGSIVRKQHQSTNIQELTDAEMEAVADGDTEEVTACEASGPHSEDFLAPFIEEDERAYSATQECETVEVKRITESLDHGAVVSTKTTSVETRTEYNLANGIGSSDVSTPVTVGAAGGTSSPVSNATHRVQAQRVFTVSAVAVDSAVGPNTASPSAPVVHNVQATCAPSHSGEISPQPNMSVLPPQTLTAAALASNNATQPIISYGPESQRSNVVYESLSSEVSSTSLYSTPPERKTIQPREFSFLPLQYMMQSIQSFSDNMTVKIEKMRLESRKFDDHQIRELYPRMPWHDIHGCITGLPARDLAAHFVQRWNHHRVSKGQTNLPILTDVTDNPHFSVCAKCNLEHIYETVTVCPRCGYDLGPSTMSLTFRDNPRKDCPLESGVSSYISFACYFSSQLGCRIQGDGPVLVTLIVNPETLARLNKGTVVEKVGDDEHIASLMEDGLKPRVGDVLVSVEDVNVLHLNTAQIQRFIVRQRNKIRKQFKKESDLISETESIATSRISTYTDRKMKVIFRRHYVNNVDDIERHDRRVKMLAEEAEIKQRHQLQALNTRNDGMTNDMPESPVGRNDPPQSDTTPTLQTDDADMTSPASGGNIGIVLGPGETEIETGFIRDTEVNTGVDSAHNRVQDEPIRQAMLSTDDEEWDHESARIDLVCRACTSREVCKAMVDLQNQVKADAVLPNKKTLCGTCQVQVLRSVGPWSVGHVSENSIHMAWVNAIQQAQHFIYIENQFFIGDLAGSDVKNTIARAVLDRVVSAANRQEDFKVIVVVPVHPEGDFIGSSGPRGVMHYQYKTICRGTKSLIEQFKYMTQGRINPLEYICFCSLRNWGQMDNKVVFDMIYVHDKLLIVDDRVLIFGSANVNDRSMLGDRDTEIAIRVEDTAHITSKMNKKPWVVGVVPHMFRKRLMAKHLNDFQVDLTDPICRDIYWTRWVESAQMNSRLYDELDGPCSYDKCATVDEYEKALATKPFLDANDPLVESYLVRIRGHLVMWPQKFLEKENLLSLATKAVLPCELFA
eukprot:CAMPEP_0185033702 /NCGR_PEP_ID=MMETSP1103-20130426/22923_1 /TAXON_ID=36769 /ORGANISM="Paraphysomonas bandaiensis, Strain Caron Lab Isolate" /LENGTH=1391 /DNA_ID=CAMNT_0027570077 /DNA_START=374 /DNA_END=4549 /DNA_ORIENTATION=-